MDGTLLTVLLVLVFATVLALVQRYRRDRCLKSFEGFHATLAEDGGDLVWGRLAVYASGMEVEYAAPVTATQGHYERSFLFYKEQYEALGALYRYPEGLSQEQQFRRAEVIRATARPGPWRRLRRRFRNWVGMVRDALVQAVSVVVGAAQAQRPGGVAAQQGGEGIKALSKEMVGHAGTAYDPLLERHLFRQVVLEVSLKDGTTRSYCGWLKDYTSDFIEVVDAFTAEAGAARPVESYPVPERAAADDPSQNGTKEKERKDDAPAALRVESGKLSVTNESAHLLYVESVRAEEQSWQRALGCLLPPGTTADLALPPGVGREALRVRMGRPERVDLVVPRRRAVVRHAADGSEDRRQAVTSSIMAEAATQRTTPPEHPLAAAEAPETSDAPPSRAAPAESEYAPRPDGSPSERSTEDAA